MPSCQSWACCRDVLHSTQFCCSLSEECVIRVWLPLCPSCALQIVHELIERFDAHLTAEQYFSVIANMKGTSPEDVASRLLNVPGLEGLQVGPLLRMPCTPHCVLKRCLACPWRKAPCKVKALLLLALCKEEAL